MKKAFLLILIGLICSISATFSQIDVSFGFDQSYDLIEKNDYVRIIGADAQGFYALRIDEKDDLFLEYFNGSSKNKESVNQLILPMIDGFQAKYLEMFYIGGKLVLFTEVLNNTAREKSLYIQHVNRNGQIEGEPKIIGRLANQNIAVDFKVQLTPNNQNIFVYYSSLFQAYNEEPFFYKVFDPNLKEIYNHRIRLPLKGDVFRVLQTEITNSGKVLILAEVRPDERRAQRMRNIVYDYRFMVFNPVTETIETHTVSANRFELQNLIFGVDDDENVDFYGFMARRGRTEYEGIFHEKLDINTMQVDRRGGRNVYYVFERAETPVFRSERLMEVRAQQYNYELIDVLHLSNGGSVVIAEHRNHWVDSIVVPGSREVIYNDYYKYNDILIAYTGPSNEMEWMTRIPKNQHSINDLGLYSSFSYGVSGEKIFLFYNEHPRNIRNLSRQNLNGEDYRQLRSPNRNGQGAYVAVFSDGQIQGGDMFIGRNSRNFIIPELLKRFHDKYYVYTQRRNSFKFATFTVL